MATTTTHPNIHTRYVSSNGEYNSVGTTGVGPVGSCFYREDSRDAVPVLGVYLRMPMHTKSANDATVTFSTSQVPLMTLGEAIRYGRPGGIDEAAMRQRVDTYLRYTPVGADCVHPGPHVWSFLKPDTPGFARATENTVAEVRSSVLHINQEMLRLVSIRDGLMDPKNPHVDYSPQEAAVALGQGVVGRQFIRNLDAFRQEFHKPAQQGAHLTPQRRVELETAGVHLDGKGTIPASYVPEAHVETAATGHSAGRLLVVAAVVFDPENRTMVKWEQRALEVTGHATGHRHADGIRKDMTKGAEVAFAAEHHIHAYDAGGRLTPEFMQALTDASAVASRANAAGVAPSGPIETVVVTAPRLHPTQQQANAAAKPQNSRG